jgi:hypothetical protein
MSNETRLVLKAAQGRAVALPRGRHLRVVNTAGTQVVDTWAFAASGVGEYLSLEHCREVLQTLYYAVGESLVTNAQRPILTIVADTTPGMHDTLIAACNARMYELAGRGPDHANCSDNLRRVLAGEGLEIGHVPQPWNLFMNAPVRDGRCIEFVRPTCEPGDYVDLRAEMDCLVVLSACQDDVYPTNGGDGTPRDVDLLVHDGAT